MTWLPPGQAEPDQDLTPIGLPHYSPEAVSEGPIMWAPPLPQPVSRWRLVARSLASQVATPVARVVAVGSATGWIAATVIFVWTLASGHVLSSVTGGQPVADTAVALFDFGAVLLALRRRLQYDSPTRAARKALRRARMPAGRTPGSRTPGMSAFLRRGLHFLSLPAVTAILPRPLGGLLACGIWTSALAAGWQLPAGIVILVGPGDPGVQGQQVAASIWMIHLIAWCSIACRRVSRSRR